MTIFTRTFAKALSFVMVSLLLAGSAQAAWLRAESPRFIVYSELSETELQTFTTQLEQFDHLLRGYTGTNAEPAELKVRIFMVADAAAVQRYIGAGSDVAGFYYGSVNGPLAVVPRDDLGFGFDRINPRAILFHEYTHHFMLQYFSAAYPAWYVEGFAEYFATVRFRDDGAIEVGLPPVYRTRSFEYGRWVSADRMLSNEIENDHMTYAQGWLITHFAATDPEIRAMLSDYLTRLRDGETGREAYTASFGSWDRSFDRVLRRYLARNRFPASALQLDPIPAEAISITEISDEEAAIVLLQPRSSGEMHSEVLRVVEHYPNNPQAYVELALDHFADEEFDEAMALVDHALALQPDHVEANIAKADIMLAMAENSEDPESPYWEQSREYIIRANNAEPNNPSALGSYYMSFSDRESRPESAVAALERAFVLVRQNVHFRLILAEEYLAQERYAEALNIITPLARNPHGGEMIERAQSIMTAASEEHQLPADETE